MLSVEGVSTARIPEKEVRNKHELDCKDLWEGSPRNEADQINAAPKDQIREQIE